MKRLLVCASLPFLCGYSNADFMDAQSWVGHERVLSGYVCPKPGFTFDQGCYFAQKDKVKVLDVVPYEDRVFTDPDQLAWKVEVISTGLVGFTNYGFAKIDEWRAQIQAQRPIPKIGMSKEESYKTSWGFPDRQNIVEVPGGAHLEQLVFEEHGYLYLKNGKIVDIQKNR